jgi:hypothetical protein
MCEGKILMLPILKFMTFSERRESGKMIKIKMKYEDGSVSD